MKMPSAFWETTYSASRRRNRHRCVCCNKIVAEGEQIFMARLQSVKTKVLHVACSEKPATNGFTQLQLLEAHGMEYLSGCGFAEAKRFVQTSPIFKAGKQ